MYINAKSWNLRIVYKRIFLGRMTANGYVYILYICCIRLVNNIIKKSKTIWHKMLCQSNVCAYTIVVFLIYPVIVYHHIYIYSLFNVSAPKGCFITFKTHRTHKTKQLYTYLCVCVFAFANEFIQKTDIAKSKNTLQFASINKYIRNFIHPRYCVIVLLCGKWIINYFCLFTCGVCVG